jgi:23S rRNA pseudouridine2605 synthase
MDDDSKKPPRGGKPGAGGKSRGPRDGGRPGAKVGKPGEKRRFGDKPAFGKTGKPFRPAPARADAAGERAPRGAGKQFREGPQVEGKSFKPRSESKPYTPRGEGSFKPRGEGSFKPRGEGSFKPRGEGSFKPRGEGSFKPRGEGSFKPRGEGNFKPRGDKPFRPREDGDRPERAFRERPQSEGKPFAPRGEGATRPAQTERFAGRDVGEAKAERAQRPFRAGPEGKPYAKRGEGTGDFKPRRFERDVRPGSDGDRPRRFDKPSGGGGFQTRKPFEKREGGPPRQEGERKSLARPGTAGGEEAEGERIAKRLARVGIASRRDAEELIAAGRVRVNGRVLESPAFNVTADDVIELDGNPLPPVERTRLFLFHKPAGVVTTSRDPEGRKTVFDVLPSDLPRLITVGRLDINTEGLMLLTNDGGLARTLELPATGWLRRYRARVHGKVAESALVGLKDGIAVDGVFYGSIEASLDREQGSNAWLTLGLREGKNREVKNILGALGLDVNRLIRISFGPFQLGDLPEGHVQELKGKMLREQLGERLIEESGANFEAEIVKPFSNKPVRRAEAPVEEVTRPRIVRDGMPGRIGEGGLIKNRKRRENGRDEALGKLSTKPRFERGDRPDRGPKPEFGDRPRGKPEFGDRPRGKKGEREQRPIEPPGVRKANVWMAPGARPQGAGRVAAEKAEADAKKARRPAFGKPGGGKRFDKPRGEAGAGRGASRPPHSGKPPRKGE